MSAEGNYFADDGAALDGPARRLDASVDLRVDPDDLDVELSALPANDLANARRMIRRHDGRLWSTREWGFGVFDGRRFDFQQGDQAAGRLAHETAERLLSHEVPAFYQHQKRELETEAEFQQRAGRFHGFAVQAGNNGRTEAMLKQAERILTRTLAEFDQDPDRLCLANGTLVLPRDGSPPRFTQGWDPADLMTKAAGAKWDPQAKCPTFDAFLEQVQPDPEVRAFLARAIGYCLTGHVAEQAYFVFQGKGGDGKSTFLTAIENAMGDYASNADIETFLHRERKGQEASPDLARLAGGVRLVKASEPEQGSRLAEAMLKRVTGGEPLVARALHRDPFEFLPQWKLIISCNRKPQIRGDDRGIWRRTLVVPWPVSIAEDKFDKGLSEKLKAEASGILNWIVAGWADWLERGGLAPPQAVRDAVADYRLNSNPFGAWFDECCVQEDGKREPAGRLLRSYRGWVAGQGFEAMNETSFGRALSDRNLGRLKTAGIIMRTGVRLSEAGEEAIRAAEQAEQDARYGP